MIRDDQGCPTKNLCKGNVLLAEALGLRAGLVAPSLHGYMKIQILTDTN